MQSQGSQAQVGVGIAMGRPHHSCLSRTGCVEAHPPSGCSSPMLQLSAEATDPGASARWLLRLFRISTDRQEARSLARGMCSASRSRTLSPTCFGEWTVALGWLWVLLLPA